ncbi:TetR/AcrR family transcriptional regulator [Kocuria sp. M4R2S49]|uniref:TetR/AcrR family transcriptional regulator n=1 Tax=Kocuria rhizosphaericola TaxID=3376284 RepID=UPI0037A976A3
MARLREAQKQTTRQLLLDKGPELFGTKGYAGTTIDDIAVAAGTTRATFCLHFPWKADLVRSLVADDNALLTGSDDPPLPSVIRSGTASRSVPGCGGSSASGPRSARTSRWPTRPRPRRPTSRPPWTSGPTRPSPTCGRASTTPAVSTPRPAASAARSPSGSWSSSPGARAGRVRVARRGARADPGPCSGPRFRAR